MSDYIIHAVGTDKPVRIFAATTRDTVERARVIHNMSPVATAALGRLLSAGAMMGSMLKGLDDLLTLKIDCSGPIGGLTVTAKPDGTVKGYVNNPQVMLPASSSGKLDVGKALDLGVLSVIRDMGLKEPYVGQTQLVSGEIAEDLTYYFATSEQTNSSVALGVLMNHDNTVRQAGGFILQLMPEADDALIDRLEENIKGLPSVTSMLDQGMSPEGMIRRVMEGFDVTFYEPIPTGFVCDCSEERVKKAVVSLGKEELAEMVAENEPVEVCCEFCGKHYVISVDELKSLLR